MSVHLSATEINMLRFICFLSLNEKIVIFLSQIAYIFLLVNYRAIIRSGSTVIDKKGGKNWKDVSAIV